jgi:hypothetical protein
MTEPTLRRGDRTAPDDDAPRLVWADAVGGGVRIGGLDFAVPLL